MASLPAARVAAVRSEVIIVVMVRMMMVAVPNLGQDLEVLLVGPRRRSSRDYANVERTQLALHGLTAKLDAEIEVSECTNARASER